MSARVPHVFFMFVLFVLVKIKLTVHCSQVVSRVVIISSVLQEVSSSLTLRPTRLDHCMPPFNTVSGGTIMTCSLKFRPVQVYLYDVFIFDIVLCHGLVVTPKCAG